MTHFFLRYLVLAVVCISIIGFPGCITIELEEAFKGSFSPTKSNKIINDYCQSCHLHKDFDPGAHIMKVRRTYKQEVYKNTMECRVCHYIEKLWHINQYKRKTRRPADVDRGMYRGFEQDEKKRAKQIEPGL